MKPKHIIIVRHGQSEANVNKELYENTPDHMMQITEVGKEQAAVCGQKLKPLLNGKNITIWQSPYMRTRQTAEAIISQLDDTEVKIKEDPRLREQEWGNFYTLEQGRRENEERKRHSDFFYRVTNGESGADVYDRISTFLETLHRDFAEDDWTESILISTHGITALVFLMRFFHWRYEEYETTDRFDNCDFVVLKLNETSQKYEILQDNRSIRNTKTL
ncbi:histidine phosphatase family protein [Deferribacteres bacterium DY0037]